MSEAYRLNCSEFGADDMGQTKFASYFSFYQTFSAKFKTQCYEGSWRRRIAIHCNGGSGKVPQTIRDERKANFDW